MLARLFASHPRLTILVVLLLLVGGAAALQSLARQEDPTLTPRYGSIVTFFPGASALRVESLVTEPIEAELREIPEITELTSTSRTGVSFIEVDLADEIGPDQVDELWSKVRDRIDDAEARLPPGALPPDFEDRTSTAVTLLAAFVWEREDEPAVDILTRLAVELQNRLRNVDGTKEVELHGWAEEEIRVVVDPLVLASQRLTPAEISAAIARADPKAPAGQLRESGTDLVIEVGGELDTIERVRRIPIRQDADGRVLRLGDTASVEKTVREPPSSMAFIHGRRAVAVAAKMESDRRVDLWMARARAVVEGLEPDVPRGITLQTVFDQSEYTQARLETLAGNLLLASGIVFAVLLVMMGLRSAIVIGAALPLTVASVLTLFNVVALPLHQMSVTGLIIALGLLIDNAIVVVDEYRLRLDRGLEPIAAVASTGRHLFVPLFASTLTTALAFLPVVVAGGGMSEFVGPISIGVIFAIWSSFFLSMTVLPAFATRIVRRSDGTRARRFWRDGFSHPRLTRAYKRGLDLALRRPSVGIAVSLVLPLIGFVVGSTLPEQFFPANDRNQFQVQIALPPQASLEQTRALARRAQEIIEARDGVVESHWFIGEAGPRVYYNMMGNQDGVSSYAGGFVTTTSPEATARILPELQVELAAALPSARVLALPFEQGPPFDAPIEVRVVGPDLDALRQLGEELRALLSRTPGVTYTVAQLSGGRPKLVVNADEAEAQLAGLRLTEIADQLAAKLEGATGGSVLEANEELPVRVRVAGEDRSQIAWLASDYLLPGGAAAESGGVPGVPLSAVAKLDLVPELAGIPRRDGERANTVQAFLAPFSLISKSLDAFLAELEASDFQLPPGYRLELGGEDAERAQSVNRLLAFALPLFVVMAGTIILAFNSFRMAALIGAVAFLSVGLALFGVWLFGHPMGFMAIIGTMGLVGLAINDSIVVLSALRAHDAECDGDPAKTREVVVDCTRHILATTFTTMGGFLPLILFGGRFWPPLATAIAGGVAGAAILALFFVPTVYLRLRPPLARSETSGEAPRELSLRESAA